MRIRVVLALVAALMAAGTITAVAVPVPSPDPCDALFRSNTIANLKAFDDCRFDRIEQAIPGNQTVTAEPTTVTPDPVTTTVTAPPVTVTVDPATSTVTTTATVTASPTSASPTPSPTPPPPMSTSATTQPAVLNLPREPWYGGVNYYKQFPVADAAGWADAGFFPISVFLGKPSHAAQLKAIGINTYMGAEHDGSTLASITNTGMFVLAQDEWTPTEIGSNGRVVGYQVSDECDMGYSGCTPDWNHDNGEAGRLAIQQGYVSALRARNDGRFLHANFGNGVLRTFWAPTTMPQHVQLMDSSSVDKYAYTSPHVQGLLPASRDWPAGAAPKSAGAYGWLEDQMERFQDPAKIRPNWVFIETAKPYLTEAGATSITVPQIGNAVWASIVHGANGIAYFQHNNDGCGNYSLVDCSQALRDGVKAINAQVTSLATVINTQSYVWNFNAGVDTMLKVHDGSAYVFTSLGLNQTVGAKTLTLPADVTGTTVEVVGEGRSLTVSGGKFTDTFDAEGAHHIYKIAL